jgi:hypothetical protein
MFQLNSVRNVSQTMPGILSKTGRWIIMGEERFISLFLKNHEKELTLNDEIASNRHVSKQNQKN